MSRRAGSKKGCDRGKLGASVQQRVKIVGSTQAACADCAFVYVALRGHHRAGMGSFSHAHGATAGHTGGLNTRRKRHPSFHVDRCPPRQSLPSPCATVLDAPLVWACAPRLLLCLCLACVVMLRAVAPGAVPMPLTSLHSRGVSHSRRSPESSCHFVALLPAGSSGT